ncbi:hypothetical protein C8J56DRAFT_483077 [Mycena floridula]|nr:hypothetical protein C8J56DRAFT_483077 [Mycena floridula]
MLSSFGTRGLIHLVQSHIAALSGPPCGRSWPQLRFKIRSRTMSSTAEYVGRDVLSHNTINHIYPAVPSSGRARGYMPAPNDRLFGREEDVEEISRGIHRLPSKTSPICSSRCWRTMNFASFIQMEILKTLLTTRATKPRSRNDSRQAEKAKRFRKTTYFS